MTELSSRQMAKLLKRFSIHEGDIVLVKSSKFDEKEILELMKKGVERLGISSVFVVMVNDFDDIKTLNRQEMNANGWYNLDQINKVVMKRG